VHFQRAVDIDPTVSYYWYNYGNCLRDAGMYARSVDGYKKAVGM